MKKWVPFLSAALATLLLTSSRALAEGRNIRIGWLMIIDWQADYPEAPECLRDHPDRPVDWNITFEPVWFDQIFSGIQRLTDYTMVVATGHYPYVFSAEQRAVLETYLDAGGILWLDDCGYLELDNLPYDYEINFGRGEYNYWGRCYGDYFTILVPDHPLLNTVFQIGSASMIRTDRGLNDAQWFTPPSDWDPRYTVVITGRDVSGQSGPGWGFSGPFLMAARVSNGKIAASFGDTTCALQCRTYGNPGRPLFDYYWIYNLLGWVDSDDDSIEDWMEGAFRGAPNISPVDTDSDMISDYLDVDSDGDGILDVDEAGDSDPATSPVDTDGDGIEDFRDNDSDGDTIEDSLEERTDTGGDGRADPDADSDGIPNRHDMDSDGDGNPDSDEGSGDVDGDEIPNFVDSNDRDGPLFAEEEPAVEPEVEAVEEVASEEAEERGEPSEDAASEEADLKLDFCCDYVMDFYPSDGESEGVSEDVPARASPGCGCVIAM